MRNFFLPIWAEIYLNFHYFYPKSLRDITTHYLPIRTVHFYNSLTVYLRSWINQSQNHPWLLPSLSDPKIWQCAPAAWSLWRSTPFDDFPEWLKRGMKTKVSKVKRYQPLNHDGRKFTDKYTMLNVMFIMLCTQNWTQTKSTCHRFQYLHSKYAALLFLSSTCVYYYTAALFANRLSILHAVKQFSLKMHYSLKTTIYS